jgi:Rap1a immunity proteins
MLKANVLLLLLASTCGVARAQDGGFFMTADRLSADCRTTIRLRDNPVSPSPQAVEDLKDAQICIGYVTGALDAFEFERISGSQKFQGQSLCVPSDVRSIQSARVFVKYADDHPEELHLAAPHVVWEAMHQAFPCTK